MTKTLFSFIQAAINRQLSLDPESKRLLQPLTGKIIQIELTGLNAVFQFIFTEHGIQVTEAKHLANTVIKGSPLSLTRLAFVPVNQRKKFFEQDLEIQGEVELAQQVIQLLDQLQLDWEEWLSQKIGDVPAYHLGKLWGQFKKRVAYTRSAFRDNIDDYLHEEREFFPTAEMLQVFFGEVDTLRMDVDRIALRANKVIQKTKTNSSAG